MKKILDYCTQHSSHVILSKSSSLFSAFQKWGGFQLNIVKANKSKTKVNVPANQIGHRQYSEPIKPLTYPGNIKTCGWHQARENVRASQEWFCVFIVLLNRRVSFLPSALRMQLWTTIASVNYFRHSNENRFQSLI